MRILPAVKALQIASQDQTMPNYVITLEPMLVQMYGSGDSNVLDMELVDEEECRALGLLNGESQAVLLEERIHQSPADVDLYGAQIAFLDGFARTPLYRNEDFTVERVAFAGGSRAGIAER